MAADSNETPHSGWQLPHEEREVPTPTPEAIAQLVEKLLELLPPELAARMTQAIHDLLEAIRALIDWWLARLQHRAQEPVQTRDIPIL